MTRPIGAMFLLLALLAGSAVAALDDAGESAAALLRDAMTPRRDGSHEALLEALRRLGDPTLRPLFETLAAAEQPSLRMHGILGLAELDPARRMALATIGELEYAPLQAELIAAAMDRELLSLDDARQLIGWADLPLPVKLVIATHLLAADRLDDTAVLDAALASENLGRRALAGLLLHQMGDRRGQQALISLDASTERNRDAIRAELMRTAVRHRFDRVAAWAHAVAVDPQVDPELQMIALSCALRFGHAPASGYWKQLYESHAGNLGRQRRLGILALRVAPWVDAGLFEPLTRSEDAMLADIGRAGRAIADDAADLSDRVAALLEHRHPLVNNWALAYAGQDARPDVAQFVLLGLIVAYEAGNAQDRLARLDDAAQAALSLMEIDPAAGAKLLRPVLAEPATDPLLRQAILLGLLRVDLDKPSDVIEGLTFSESDSARLALLLRACDGAELDAAQMRDLRLIVRGGSRIQGPLRVQAAWNYLKRTGQIDAALQRALRP